MQEWEEIFFSCFVLVFDLYYYFWGCGTSTNGGIILFFVVWFNFPFFLVLDACVAKILHTLCLILDINVHSRPCPDPYSCRGLILVYHLVPNENLIFWDSPSHFLFHFSVGTEFVSRVRPPAHVKWWDS